MKFSWIKLIAGGFILTIIVTFPLISIFNVFIYKIPIKFSDQQTSSEPLYTASTSLHFFHPVSPENPSWQNLIITEDRAWEHAWAFYQNNVGMTVFLPMDKRSLGLHQVIDENNNRFLAWEFDVMQNNYRFIGGGCTHGGTVMVDAYTGKILYFIAVC